MKRHYKVIPGEKVLTQRYDLLQEGETSREGISFDSKEAASDYADILNDAFHVGKLACAKELKETLGPRSLCGDPTFFQRIDDLIRSWEES